MCRRCPTHHQLNNMQRVQDVCHGASRKSPTSRTQGVDARGRGPKPILWNFAGMWALNARTVTLVGEGADSQCSETILRS